MGQNVTDIYFAAVEMNLRDEPVFVAADIENEPVVYFIGGGESLSQFGKIVEFSLLHNLNQRLNAIWLSGCFSQNWISVLRVMMCTGRVYLNLRYLARQFGACEGD